MQQLHPKTYLSLGLLSTGLIAFELVLIQIFSITQWYHFAYMIISVAMLGFGAAGTALSLFEQWLVKRYDFLFPILLFLSSLSMAGVLGISSAPFIRFDTYLIFSDLQQVGRLILTYLLFFIPFFLAALALGLSFLVYVRHIGSLYAADLLGSGLGAVVGLLLMWVFLPRVLPGLIALLPWLAGLLAVRKKASRGTYLTAVISLAVISFSIIHPPRLSLSQFKSLSKTLLLPQAKVEIEKNSPYGLVQLVSSPALRHSPGLSLNYQKAVPVRKVIFNNGEWGGALTPLSDPDSTLLDYTTSALPYIIGSPQSALILNAGTGEQVAYALAKGVKNVKMVDPNPLILSLLRTELAEETDSLLFHPSLQVRQLEARSFLYGDTNQYELIILPVISSLGGNAGLNALQEQYIMTRPAFRQMFHKLTPQGMISISSWMDYPARNPLKLLATLIETLEYEGVENPENQLVAIRSWGTITFLLKKSPFRSAEIEALRDFCRLMSFDPVVLPDLKPFERQQYNQLQDTMFFSYVDAILSPNRSAFYGSYVFNIQPATDDRPYFSQFIRWSHFLHLSEVFGLQGSSFLETGYVIVGLTFFQISLIALIMIILPLFKLRFKGAQKGRILGYFGGIGLGYMFVEIVLIQRFILYFGHPIYATAAVISCMLIASGLGSYCSDRWRARGFQLGTAALLIMALLGLIALTVRPVLLGTITWPLYLKTGFLFFLIFPLGFLMGLPFPTGIAVLTKDNSSAVAWAWGINAYCSVISTALATLIAVEFGFLWVLGGGALGYLCALVSSLSR